MDTGGDNEKRDVRRPMNAFLIFCKRHRSIVREKNPDLDNRSVTRILGDLWANLKDNEKVVYTDLAKQYKDAFMKANPDYKWHNPEKATATQKVAMPKPTNVKVIRNDLEMMSEGSIIPGKLADPSNMGGLSLLLIAGQQSETSQTSDSQDLPESNEPVLEEPSHGTPVINKVKWSEESVTKATSREPSNSPTKTTMEAVLPVKSDVDRIVLLKSEENRREVNEKQKPFHFETNNENIPELKASNSLCGTGATKVDECVKDSASGDLVTSLSKVVAMKNDLKYSDETSSKTAATKVETVIRPAIPAWSAESIIKDKESSHKSLLALAEMCESKTVSVAAENPSKPLLFQAVAAPKMSSKSLLAEAFMDTCDKGGYSDILKDKSAYAKWAKGDNQLKCMEDKYEHIDSKSEVAEKENISKLMIKDVGETPEGPDEESPMITCGKLVVNHIIDRIFSSDIATAARRASTNSSEKSNSNSLNNNGKQVNTEGLMLSSMKSGVTVKQENKCEIGQNVPESELNEYDEPDGVKENHDLEKDEQNKPCLTETTSETASVQSDEKIAEKMETEQSSVSNLSAELETVPESDSLDTKQLSPLGVSYPSPASREEDGEGEMEDSEDYQPVRKSRRRNRGQRYQELINEGIIQPSKERMAALKHEPPKEECSEEDFQSIDSYILPETAIRRIRKRTTSESAKDKMHHLDDAKRYKTGDFDLEAHIATLPACPVESMGRKRGFIRQRHHSETTHIKKDEHTQLPVFDIKKAVSLPPHVKIPSPEKSSEPVVGSRKRKARKHSITHLLPAPPALISNGNEVKATGLGIVASHDDIKNKSESVSSSESAESNKTESCEMDVFNSTEQTSSVSTHNVESEQQSPPHSSGDAVRRDKTSDFSCSAMCNTAVESRSIKGIVNAVNQNNSTLCSVNIQMNINSQSEMCERLVNTSDKKFDIHENKNGSKMQSNGDMARDFTGRSGKNVDRNETSPDDQRFKQLDHNAFDIPEDQSATVSYERCRSEVNTVSCDTSGNQSGTVSHEVIHTTNFTHRDYRSGAELTQCSAREKDKDMNFNTKVQC